MIELLSFGSFQLRAGGKALTFTNRKTQALLSYLACNSSLEHERAILADMFWPGLSRTAAHNNVSKALGQLRKVYRQVSGGEQCIRATRHTVQLLADPVWQLDAALMTRLVEQADGSSNATDRITLLAEAAELYRGEFMAGLALEDCPEFEAWLLFQREKFMLMARDSLQKLTDHYLDSGAYEAARDSARRQLTLDSWHEAAHRQLMRALDGMGLRGDALAQYEACREVLRSELGLEPEEATRALAEQIRTGGIHTETTGQPSTLIAKTAMLPKRLLPLIGREKELAALRHDLGDPACRMITIVGPGGVGKTTLALEAARQVAHDHRDGAVFVPLDQLQLSPDENLQEMLATTIGAALGIAFSGRQSASQQLFWELRDLDLLLVLDNFEQLLDATRPLPAPSGALFLISLLESAPGAKVVITSRQQFGIPMEYVLPLEGLPLPPEGAAPDSLPEYSSIRLFVEQARRNQRDFRLTAENGAAVAATCRLVGGLPLGIELAARLVPHFTLIEIAAAIQDNLDILRAENPQLTERHQSMRATFAYSWQMLTQHERQMLARLAIIPSQFSREAAIAVTLGSLGDLVRLQGKSLLRQEGPGLYSLHPLLRQFVAEKLSEQPAAEQTALQRRFFTFYLQLLAEQGQGIDEARTGEAIKAIARNIDNIRGAWQLALDADAFDLLDVALQPLFHFYRIQGMFQEGRQLFGHTTSHFRQDAVANSGDGRVQQLLGRALLRQGRLSWLMGETEAAARVLQEGLDVLRQGGSQQDLSRAYAYLGEAALGGGRIAAAESLLASALALFRQEGNSPGIATTLELQAFCASRAQHFEAADELFRESINLNQEQGNRRLEGRGLHDWGLILIQQGRMAEAADRLAGSLIIAKELELKMPIAFNESMLARIDRHTGELERARQRLTSSLQVLDGSGYAFYTIAAQNMLGEVLSILGQEDAAKQSLDQALAQLRGLQLAESAEFDYPILDFLVAVAYYFSHMGRVAASRYYLQRVLSRTDAGTDLRQRASQLWRDMGDSEYGTADNRPFTEVLREFVWGETGD